MGKKAITYESLYLSKGLSSYYYRIGYQMELDLTMWLRRLYMKNNELPEDFLEVLSAVTNKRARFVIDTS